MESWISSIKDIAEKDSLYTKKYGEYILCNMFQELNYLRRKAWRGLHTNIKEEAHHIVNLYQIDTTMIELMRSPKYKAKIESELESISPGFPKVMPCFGMTTFYDGHPCELKDWIDEFEESILW